MSGEKGPKVGRQGVKPAAPREQAEEAAHARAKAALKAFLLRNEESKAAQAAARLRSRETDLRLLALGERVEAARDAARAAPQSHNQLH